MTKKIKKIRFIEPGNLSYQFSIKNYFVYDEYIRTPSTGLLTLTTIVQKIIPNTLMYSESISKLKWKDILDADLICIGIFSFNANRGYEIAKYIRSVSNAIILFGGLHASLNYQETIKYCDYILTGDGDESIVEFISAINENKKLEFPGIVYKKNNDVYYTGIRKQPENIDTIPNRDLLYRYRKMTGYNTI